MTSTTFRHPYTFYDTKCSPGSVSHPVIPQLKLVEPHSQLTDIRNAIHNFKNLVKNILPLIRKNEPICLDALLPIVHISLR